MDCLICSTDGTKGKKREERDGGEEGKEWDEGTRESNLYQFVLAQIFAVFFTIVKNSANIYEKSCANIYVNIRCAKNSATNCASLIFPQILAQIFAEINSVQKIPQMFAIFLSDRGVPGV